MSVRLRLFTGICFLLFNNNMLGQYSSKDNIPTFHVKLPFDKKNGISFIIEREKTHDNITEMVWKGIFVSTNGEAYIYWTNRNSNLPWDSVSVSSDTVLINNMREIITPDFFNIARHLGDNVCLKNDKDTSSFYYYQFTVIENGHEKFYKNILINHFSNKSKHARKKLTPVIDIFENAYEKYATHK